MLQTNHKYTQELGFPYFEFKIRLITPNFFSETTYWSAIWSANHYTTESTVSWRHRKTFTGLQSCLTGSSLFLLIRRIQYEIGRTRMPTPSCHFWFFSGGVPYPKIHQASLFPNALEERGGVCPVWVVESCTVRSVRSGWQTDKQTRLKTWLSRILRVVMIELRVSHCSRHKKAWWTRI